MKELKAVAMEDIIIVLIGNKCDLEDKREVTKEEATKLKNDHEIDLVETSAATG